MENDNTTMRKLSHSLHARHFPHTHSNTHAYIHTHMHIHTLTVMDSNHWLWSMAEDTCRTPAAEFTPQRHCQANDALR